MAQLASTSHGCTDPDKPAKPARQPICLSAFSLLPIKLLPLLHIRVGGYHLNEMKPHKKNEFVVSYFKEKSYDLILFSYRPAHLSSFAFAVFFSVFFVF